MNNSTNTSSIIYETETSLKSHVTFVIAIPSALANILAIIIFTRSVKRDGPIVNIFLLCLGWTDLLGCLYSVYATTSPLYQHLMTVHLCKFITFVATFLALHSALIAALLSVDRYFALCWPYRYESLFSKKKAYIFLIIVFLTTVSVCVLNLIGLGFSHFLVVNSDGSENVVCSSQRYQESPQQRAFGILYGSIGTAILLLVVFCNLRVICVVRKMMRNIVTIGTITNRPIASNNLAQRDVNFVWVIGGLSVTLIICWAPFMANALLIQCGVEIEPSYKIIAFTLASLNYIVDPFVFIVLRKSYRKEAIELMWCCSCVSRSPIRIADNDIPQSRNMTEIPRVQNRNSDIPTGDMATPD